MNLKLVTACMLASMVLPATAIPAETPAKAAAAQPIKESETLERRATITAIDVPKRLVTLKGQDGDVFEVEAGTEIRNFEKLQVGRRRRRHLHRIAGARDRRTRRRRRPASRVLSRARRHPVSASWVDR